MSQYTHYIVHEYDYEHSKVLIFESLEKVNEYLKKFEGKEPGTDYLPLIEVYSTESPIKKVDIKAAEVVTHWRVSE